MAIPRRTLILSVALTLLVVSGSCVVLNRPTTTLQAIDGRVTAHTIPLYVKAIDFVQRHYQYRLLVSRICGDTEGAACATRLFDWTHENIEATPAGWPLIDDHVLNIVIRGHGHDWQRALVFATLSSYAGMRAFIHRIHGPDGRGTLVLTFVEIDDRWIPFDVDHHVTFRARDGRFADVASLVRDPASVDGHTAGILPEGFRYSHFISPRTLDPFVPPEWLHAELQNPLLRLEYEIRDLVGWN